MANELTLGSNASYAKSGIAFIFNSGTFQVTVSGTKSIRNAVSIGTSDETLDLGDIATIGFVILHNTDSTNFITVGPDGISYPIKLKPGEWFQGRWNGAAIHAKADTGACILESCIIED